MRVTLAMLLEKIIRMTTLHERISNYLHDQMPGDGGVGVAESDSTEYEYLLARAEINLQKVQKHQDKPKPGLAEGESPPIS
jgi:hypothetical protein